MRNQNLTQNYQQNEKRFFHQNITKSQDFVNLHQKSAKTSIFATFKQTEKKRKYFYVKKFLKYNQVMNTVFGEQEENNLKISENDKMLKKMKLLSKLIKKYRRKLTTLNEALKRNAEKIFTKRLSQIHFGNKKIKKQKINLDLEILIKAMKKLKNNENIYFSQEKSLIEDFIKLIIDKKLSPETSNFKVISSEIRKFLVKDKIMQISKSPKSDLEIKQSNLDSTFEYKISSKTPDNEKSSDILFGTNVGFQIQQNIFEEERFDVEDQNIYSLNLFQNLENNEDSQSFAFWGQNFPGFEKY